MRGLVIQRKRPLSSSGETTDRHKQGNSLREEALCSLHLVPMSQFYEENHCRGLKGNGIPKGLFLPRVPNLFRGTRVHPAEGLTRGATVPHFPSCPSALPVLPGKLFS